MFYIKVFGSIGPVQRSFMVMYSHSGRYCFSQKSIIGMLQVPGCICMYLGWTRSGEVCLKFIPWVTPLNVGELKV